MANVKQCDLCRNIFVGLSGINSRGFDEGPIADEVGLKKVTINSRKHIGSDIVNYEVCRGCYSKIAEFIEKLKEGANES